MFLACLLKEENHNDMYASKQCVLRTNKVAPVIIKDCREEFQQLSDLSEPIVTGSLAEGMLEHALIKGKYFLVNDANDAEDILHTSRQLNAPNFHQAGAGQPVFASGQPTLNGLTSILSQLSSDGYSEILVLNLRSEPVLFQRVDDDFAPYSVRHQDRIHSMVAMGDCKDDCNQVESFIRKQVVSMACLEDECVFFFYDCLNKLQQEPHIRKVEFEEDILLSAEIYAREAFTNQVLRYDRICLPEMGIPTEDMLDQFLSHFREKPVFLDRNSRTFPAVYLISHSGGRRSATMMVLCCLIYAHKKGNLPQCCPKKMTPHEPDFSAGEYMAVRNLVSQLKNGPLLKHQVDTIIDQCSEVINLRKCISESTAKLESIYTNNTINGSYSAESILQECVSAVETYCFLIAFNAYVTDQMPNSLSLSYKKWLQRNPEVIRLCCELDFSETCSPTSLLASQQRYLVADDYIGLDVLSSQMDVKVSNFRRLMGLPIYGMAQPGRNGLSRVANHLLHNKQGYSNLLIINLRSDYVLECDDVTYSVRDASFLAESVSSPSNNGKDLEDTESRIKKEIRNRKTWKVYQDIADPPVDKEFHCTLTPEELYQQQRLSTLDLHYRRLPLKYDHGLYEEEFDAIQSIILNHMSKNGAWSENPWAFVFHCRTGKSRTSMAMAVAGLLFYHMTGFPYGANPDEEERVSCPNARYTKGEFLVVEQLLWTLPQGQQTKREVDLVLDRLFETMSPMHFHLREVILVAFNKARSSRGTSQHLLRGLAFDFLERYLYLILYNAYLHMEKISYFKRSFTQWMKEVAAPAGVYEILDNLGFFTLENSLLDNSTRKKRIQDRQLKSSFLGAFV